MLDAAAAGQNPRGGNNPPECLQTMLADSLRLRGECNVTLTCPAHWLCAVLMLSQHMCLLRHAASLPGVSGLMA